MLTWINMSRKKARPRQSRWESRMQKSSCRSVSYKRLIIKRSQAQLPLFYLLIQQVTTFAEKSEPSAIVNTHSGPGNVNVHFSGTKILQLFDPRLILPPIILFSLGRFYVIPLSWDKFQPHLFSPSDFSSGTKIEPTGRKTKDIILAINLRSRHRFQINLKTLRCDERRSWSLRFSMLDKRFAAEPISYRWPDYFQTVWLMDKCSQLTPWFHSQTQIKISKLILSPLEHS